MIALDVSVDDDAWTALDVDALAERCAKTLIATAPAGLRPGEIAILFTNNDAVRELNATWRGKDRPTNVLSFPAVDELALPPDIPQPLGDVVLAFGVCAAEAAEKGVSIQDHASHLVIHGFLHLIGYDHQGEDEAEVMEDLERRLLLDLGIADPYTDRDRPSR